MPMTKVRCLLLVLLCCELCSSIKVPVTWNDSAHSEVKNKPNKKLPVKHKNNKPKNVHGRPTTTLTTPVAYFLYTAQKPKFATDIAAFHGVQNPQQHYKAYPIKPHTGKNKHTLGTHQMLDGNKKIYLPFQKLVYQNTDLNSFVKPTSTDYEIFHPYKAEEPSLQEIYKDPVLTKIRNDLQDSKTRLQAYEEEAGEPNIAKEEYLESTEKTEGKLFPNKNKPARYEIHKPERYPKYYETPPRDVSRENVLNKKFKHPWNQYAKVRPVDYRPLHHYIQNLREQHTTKYDDERNEYPQVDTNGDFLEPQEGYDIYEKGKNKYLKLRNNLDESVNNVVLQNRPTTFKKLELQNHEPEDEDDKDEFVPVKNYAQVRKTETYKRLPKKAAFDDAETYEEIRNAPRLREAVKSTKAQTVYTEEGYEDSAYDHAGEQKHASDHEGHGGFLKEHENSGGLYKIPTVSGKYQDGSGSEYRNNKEHGKKWKNNNKDDEEETENEEYSEDEHEEDVDANLHKTNHPEIVNRNRRKDSFHNDHNDDSHTSNHDGKSNRNDGESVSDNNEDRHKNEQVTKTDVQHEVGKREVNFEVPEIDINSTLSFKFIDAKPAKLKKGPKNEVIQEKYPYYYKNLKGVNKNSPLKYAENLKLIPRKSNGGTEFYDSRSRIECSEVDEEVDPIPEKLKKGENPTDDEDYENDNGSETKGNENFETVKKQPRLKGLGDKIDCFKAKYFGKNPLDSPFFEEELISNPEPIVAPKLPTYKLKKVKDEVAQESKLINVIDSSNKLQEAAKTNIFVLLDKLRSDQSDLKESLNKTNEELQTLLYTPQGTLVVNDTQQADVFTDILKNIKTTANSAANTDMPATLLYSDTDNSNATYNFFQTKEEVTKLPPILRRKRATPFVYEPYKIIRDSQVQDSKKTTTTSNISPLIKQLQSSRVAERVSRSNKDDKQKTSSRAYVDIGRKERTKPFKTENENSDATFIDVSVDHRRGEPRYEIRPMNHKSEYTPVENKRAMSVDAYRSHTSTEKNVESSTQKPPRGRQRFRSAQISARPYHDLFQFVPKTIDIQNVAASNPAKKTIASVAPESKADEQEHPEKHSNDSNSEDSSEDYEEEEEDKITSSTTTTTSKPSFRRKMKAEERFQKEKVPDHTTEKQLLKFVTRFRNYRPDEISETTEEETLQPVKNKRVEEDNITIPKYREKKKKSHTSTLVTDTKKYGERDEDDMKREVDALIGVKTNMDDYMPMYEKEVEDKINMHQSKKHEQKNDDSGQVDDEDDDDSDDDDDDNDDDDGDYDDDDDGDDDDADEEEVEGVEEASVEVNIKEDPASEVTTPEPTKRTLVRTTDAPPTTVATRIRTTTSYPTITPSRNIKPIVTRKRIEIHKELPANKSSPHVTQFKQDIKEVEIIKEIPSVPKRKPQKNVAVLDLYKDDELAKAINNLGDVEIFGEQIDLDKGPKHGGNYRLATKEDLRILTLPESSTKAPKDAETSQSKSTKHIELDEYTPKRLHGGNLKSLSDVNRSTSSSRNSKLIELSESPVRAMHGGNLKYDNKRRGSRKNEKLVELDDDHEEDHLSRQDDDYKHRGSGHERMHGGNYRSAKLIVSAPQEDNDDIQVKSSSKNTRSSAAVLLNSFVQAVPILTSTPGYIVDPSKRMYYYVDA